MEPKKPKYTRVVEAWQALHSTRQKWPFDAGTMLLRPVVFFIISNQGDRLNEDHGVHGINPQHFWGTPYKCLPNCCCVVLLRNVMFSPHAVADKVEPRSLGEREHRAHPQQ